MRFASQIFSKATRLRFLYVVAAMLLSVPALSAQVTFLGAQRTIPATGLSGPNGAAIDGAGNVFIADTGNNRILKIDPSGAQTVVSVAPLTLSVPLAIALDSSGNLYVTDNGNNRVVKVPAGGGAATAFASVFTPDGLAVDSNGNVFVADNEDGMIVKITSAGVKSNFETGLTNPVAVATDLSGNVYLADKSLSSIVKFPAGGGAGSNVGSALGGISGVAVDSAGNVYVAESGEGAAIIKITPVGTQTTLATSGLAAATYLTVDANYDLFIPDNSNSQVIEFSTISVPLGIANSCENSVTTPCTQTAILQFEVIEDSITALNVVTSGDTSLDFSSGDGTTCAGTTTPCVVQVVFSPTQPGMRTGGVQLTGEGSGLISVPVYGTGNAAEIGFVPALTSPPIGNDGFQDPVAVAVSGNGIFSEAPRVFIADDAACVIWINGFTTFEIFAGTYGSCGWSGDGGAATSAQLGHPEDVAVDGAGNVYFVDASSGVVRKVDPSGTITTVAGDPEKAGGFFGDGGPAKNAAMSDPNGIALDAAGNLYIADTNNHRIRKVDLAGIITTVAGTGTAGFSGDGGAATSAELDAPFGVRADTVGNLFIADSNNNVIRKVDLTGKISTVAGNFGAGAGYTGDGGPATSAQLAFPIYVSIDAAGQLFIADDDNSVIRRVDGNGNISTFTVPTPFPSDLVVDPTGNLAMIDPDIEALTLVVRTIPNSNDFGTTNVNTATEAQDVTVTNIGNKPLIFESITPPTGFTLGGPDTSCSTASPLNLGLDCVLGIVFDPPTAGGYEDAVVLTDNSVGVQSVGTQNIPVTGTGVQVLTPSATTLTAAPLTAFTGQTVTLTATIAPVPTGGTLGSVAFCLGGAGPIIRRTPKPATVKSLQGWLANANITSPVTSCGAGTLLQTVAVDSTGKAVLTLTNLPVGADIITAVYSGNGTLDISTSDPATVTISAPATTTTTLSISPNPGNQGQSITLTGTASPVPGAAPFGTITFCDAGSVGLTIRRPSKLAGRKSRNGMKSHVVANDGVIPCGADTSLGSGSVNAQGVATLTLTTLLTGDHNIYAVYSGAVGFAESTSDPVDEVVAAGYAVTAPQTPFIAAQGGSVTVDVNVPPLGGPFDSVVTMSATGLPPGATATFVPPTVTPGADGAPTVLTIQLKTLNPPAAGIWIPTNLWPLSFGVGLMLCALLGIAKLRGETQRRKLRIAFATAGAIGVLLIAGGCNGGFNGQPVTAPGNYTVTITGTSGALQASTTITVVVQ